MLVQAAAQQWQVDPASCTTANSEVTHKESGRKLSYGALAAAASSQTPPKDVPLKDPKDFVLIGKPLKRLDTPDKVNGKAVYGIDAMLPDMKFATLAACPVFGGKVGKVDDSAAKKIPGVRKIVVLDDTVAVVGDHMWAAKKGLDALVIDWDEGPNARLSSNDIWQDLRAASEKDGVVAKSEGDIAKGLATGERVDAAYELPFLAHATMEPLNATVHVKPDSCEVWTGTQIVARVQSEAAKAAGLPVEKVTVNNHLLGGGFGRKLEPDMVVAAVRIAKQVDGPVKVVWTREEDIQHDIYRPVYRDTISASLSDGKIVGWKYRVTGSSIMARWLPPAFQNGIDIDAIDSAVDMPYDIPNSHIEYIRAEPPAVPTGFWRGVGPNNNVFAIECFMDEAGAEGGQGSGRFPPRDAWQKPAAAGCAQSGGGKIRLGAAVAGAGRARRLRAAVVRQFYCNRGRGGSRRAGRGAFAPGHFRGRYRHRRQSRYHRGTDRGRADLRPDRRALRRRSPSTMDGCSNPTSMTTACCASTRRRRSRFTSSRAARRPAASARPARRRDRRRCATRYMLRPASPCGGCRSTAP